MQTKGQKRRLSSIDISKSSLLESSETPKLGKVELCHPTLGGLRFYATPEGVIMPSVNTFLDITNPPGSRAAIANWKKKIRRELGTKVGNRKLNMYSNRGTLLHLMIETYITTGEWVEPYSDPQWKKFVAEFDPGGWEDIIPGYVETLGGTVAVMEHPLYDDKRWMLAGTPDLCLYEGKGHYGLYDWKTSDKPKRFHPETNQWGYHLENPIESCFPEKEYKTNYSLQNKLCQLYIYLKFSNPDILNARYGTRLPKMKSFSLNLITFNANKDPLLNPEQNFIEPITVDSKVDKELLRLIDEEVNLRVSICQELHGTVD